MEPQKDKNTLIDIDALREKKKAVWKAAEPVRVDDRGEWYSMKGMCQMMKRTPERIRQMALERNPVIVKDTSLGVILYRLSQGYEFSERGGIREAR